MQKNLPKQSLNMSFIWFEKEMCTKLFRALSEFFETEFTGRLYSVTESDSIKSDFFTKNESFFTHKIPINQTQSAIIRINADFVHFCLDKILGASNAKFSIFDLTDLEVKILNGCVDFIYEKIKPYIVQNEQNAKLKGNYNLGLAVNQENGIVGKIIFSVPKNSIIQKYLPTVKNFTMSDFSGVSAEVDLVLGKTKISLRDLKNLTYGDFILLENSSIDKVTVKTKDILTSATIYPNKNLVVDLDENEHDIGGDNMTKNIWDDIQVEVSAEFKKIKMTLGDLKQITNGVVIDLDNIFENKIALVVEDKIVAKGELVIINDRYGVRVDEVIQSAPKPQPAQSKPAPKQAQQPAQKPAPKAQPKPQQPQPAQAEDEAFDYSDFEDNK